MSEAKQNPDEKLVESVAKQQSQIHSMQNFTEEELRAVIARDMSPILVGTAKRELAARGLKP